MSIRCKNCGKKHGKQLASCPRCTRLANIEVNFEGNYANGVKKFLQEMLDDIRRRLPDEDAFKTPGTIFFSSPEEIVRRRQSRFNTSQYIEKMKELDGKLKLAGKCVDLICVFKTLYESDFPDGFSVPDINREFIKTKSLRHIGFSIDIVVDQRMLFRGDAYVKGVIVRLGYRSLRL